jgi:hypothetical protein
VAAEGRIDALKQISGKHVSASPQKRRIIDATSRRHCRMLFVVLFAPMFVTIIGAHIVAGSLADGWRSVVGPMRENGSS